MLAERARVEAVRRRVQQRRALLAEACDALRERWLAACGVLDGEAVTMDATHGARSALQLADQVRRVGERPLVAVAAAPASPASGDALLAMSRMHARAPAHDGALARSMYLGGASDRIAQPVPIPADALHLASERAAVLATNGMYALHARLHDLDEQLVRAREQRMAELIAMLPIKRRGAEFCVIGAQLLKVSEPLGSVPVEVQISTVLNTWTAVQLAALYLDVLLPYPAVDCGDGDADGGQPHQPGTAAHTRVCLPLVSHSNLERVRARVWSNLMALCAHYEVTGLSRNPAFMHADTVVFFSHPLLGQSPASVRDAATAAREAARVARHEARQRQRAVYAASAGAAIASRTDVGAGSSGLLRPGEVVVRTVAMAASGSTLETRPTDASGSSGLDSSEQRSQLQFDASENAESGAADEDDEERYASPRFAPSHWPVTSIGLASSSYLVATDARALPTGTRAAARDTASDESDDEDETGFVLMDAPQAPSGADVLETARWHAAQRTTGAAAAHTYDANAL